MGLLPRKRLSPKLSDMVPICIPQHDPITVRQEYASPKELFAALLTGAKDG